VKGKSSARFASLTAFVVGGEQDDCLKTIIQSEARNVTTLAIALYELGVVERMIQGSLCKMFEARYLKIGTDVVCERLCVYYVEGGYPPCGEKPACKLFDARNAPLMELK